MKKLNKKMTADEYLSLVKDWEDPYPKPVIEKHDRFLVVRNDLLPKDEEATLSTIMNPEAKKILKDFADRKGITQGEMIEEMLQNYARTQ